MHGRAWQVSDAACYNFLTKESTVIARAMFLRPKQSPRHVGDCFVATTKKNGEFHAKNRDYLLRGLTLHQPGREPGGRITKELRAPYRIGGTDSFGRGQVRGQRERAVGLLKIAVETSRRSGRDP